MLWCIVSTRPVTSSVRSMTTRLAPRTSASGVGCFGRAVLGCMADTSTPGKARIARELHGAPRVHMRSTLHVRSACVATLRNGGPRRWCDRSSHGEMSQSESARMHHRAFSVYVRTNGLTCLKSAAPRESRICALTHAWRRLGNRRFGSRRKTDDSCSDPRHRRFNRRAGRASIPGGNGPLDKSVVALPGWRRRERTCVGVAVLRLAWAHSKPRPCINVPQRDVAFSRRAHRRVDPKQSRCKVKGRT